IYGRLPRRGRASFADSFGPRTIQARSGSASGSSTSMTPNCDRASGLTLEDIAVLRDGTPHACRTEGYRGERQPEDTLGASAADEERLQLYQKSMTGSFRTRTSLRTRPDPVLARLPGETFGID